MLLAQLIDRETLEVYVPASSKLRFHRTGDVDGGFKAEVRHSVLDDFEVDGNHTSHLDGATEADLSVSLGEVEIADGKLCPIHVDGKVDLAPAAQILDAVPSLLVSSASLSRY